MNQAEAFALLDPSLRHHITHTLGWSGLRPVQARAVPPILRGDNLVLLAPTAGGKTEAAFFPLLTRLLQERWAGLSLLYLSPIKALLNNQHQRLERLCGLVGHRAEVWHGDVSAHRKKRLRGDPPSVLLTTPESLEAMLISTRTSAQAMFSNLRAVVIDEIHAFAGADRGWHLLGVLERLSAWANHDLQRVGLSATVGNRAQIVSWLSAGSSRAQTTVDPPRASSQGPQVKLDWVGNLENAARVIQAMHKGERRLVFCDSRLQAERLTRLLRDAGQQTWLTHSSLGAAERRTTEEAFAQGEAGVIVATSALELGIDIGNLDRVLGVDAPWSVASFLQRMGRTGRRPGTRANMLLLAVSRAGLWRGAALLDLWRGGYVEPALAPPLPYHLLAQQALALVLERPGLPWSQAQRRLTPLAQAAQIPQEDLERVLEHLVKNDLLFLDGIRLGLGRRAERELGRRHYMKLVSVFTTPALFKIMHGRKEVGTVHQSTFAQEREEGSGPRVLLLAGRTWRVTSLSWARHMAWVEPFDMKGSSRWVGQSADMTQALAQAHRRVLHATSDDPSLFSRRALLALEELRDEYAWVEEAEPTLADLQARVEWWTFQGDACNRDLAARCQVCTSERVTSDGLKVTLHVSGRSQASAVLEAATALPAPPWPEPDHPYAKQLKFGDLIPEALLRRSLSARLYSPQ